MEREYVGAGTGRTFENRGLPDPVRFGARRVVLVRGAPGVGKSSCVALLGEWGVAACVIEVDSFRKLVPAVDWADRYLHTVALDAATDTACAFASAGFSPVFLVDCFGRDHVTRVVQRARAAGVESRVVALWAEASVLLARRASRSGKEAPVDSMALLINESVRVHGAHDCFIDTTGVDRVTVARMVELRIGGDS